MAITSEYDVNVSGRLKKRFYGLSSDIKPTLSHPLAETLPVIGSTFFETDTGNTYVNYDGEHWAFNRWVDPDLTPVLQNIADTLTKILEVLDKGKK
jgi:hypothetical protein